MMSSKNENLIINPPVIKFPFLNPKRGGTHIFHFHSFFILTSKYRQSFIFQILQLINSCSILMLVVLIFNNLDLTVMILINLKPCVYI